MQSSLSVLKPLTSRYLVFLLCLFVYTGIMDQCGGLPSMHTAWRLEIPLLLYFYYYCNLITRKSRLQALVTAPAGVPAARYREGGYIKRLPNDPWGRPYQYANPGLKGEIDIFSFGADGVLGGEGKDAEVGSWQ